MESYTEQVVKKQKSAKYYLNIILIIFFAAAIPTTLIVLAEILQRAYLIYIAFFSLLFCIYGSWYFITSLKVEYEYAALGSILKIDRIIAKRRRSKLLKTDVKIFDDFFRYSDEEMSKRKFSKVYNAAADPFSEKNFVATFHSEAKGNCALVFSPNEKILNAIKPYFNKDISRKIYLEKII